MRFGKVRSWGNRGFNMPNSTKTKTVQLHQDVYDYLVAEKEQESESFNDTLKRLLGMDEEHQHPNRPPDEYEAIIEIDHSEDYESMFFTEDEMYGNSVESDELIDGEKCIFVENLYGGWHDKELGGVDVTVAPKKILKILIFAETMEDLEKKVERVEKGFVSLYNQKEKEKAEEDEGYEPVDIGECPGYVSYHHIYRYTPQEEAKLMARYGIKTREDTAATSEA